ncbi:ribbon-helix-helix protein, CopG family [Leptospira meyeri]|uniref:CopG family ribbon-helix-helix protein n=1 Tax=Leptospira meyeri TaxID=29508 RepID=UPI000C2A85DA|nr:ribbon-helix-helix domain-containing protein [Leptospira meyeri]PJZ94987.1 CopG family transcriptional regulator [Leptospira meyeri]PKA22284.1 CopG family transcriptional regulator [Leptospira sp. mixed culture ATI2-C-A1]TGM60084.1 ribbon-helix-helix protein, CopG family [Leptospira meyeri]TGM74328.1 ribbon-helix-helix protein, CopG family [Leptospira meyeri]
MNQTVNISFEKALLKEIDKIAKREHRSRSELIREAARAYIEKKSKWQAILDFGVKSSEKSNLTEDDIFREIKNVRRNKKAS